MPSKVTDKGGETWGWGWEGTPTLACKCFAIEVTHITCTHSLLVRTSHLTQTP